MIRNCNVNIKIENDLVQHLTGNHMHEPMSNCEVSIIIKVEELKLKISADPNLKVRLSYLAIYEELLKTYKPLELAMYWKDWNDIKSLLYYHRRKNAPKLPQTLSDIGLSDEYTKTSSNEKFLRCICYLIFKIIFILFFSYQ